LELSSRFGNKFSNNLVVLTQMLQMIEALLESFPTVQIQDGQVDKVSFEQILTANLLDQKILTITDNFEINTGMSHHWYTQ
jgi:hypothetical protein